MQERGRATVTGTIWSLHRVIANPESSIRDVRTAKRLLLRLLEKTKASPQLEMLWAEMQDEEMISRSAGISRENRRFSPAENRAQAATSRRTKRS